MCPKVVHGAYLTGIHGRSGSDLDQIGFIITEPIDSTDLENMRYPTLGSLKSGLSPAVLFKDTYYHKAPNDIGNQKTVEETTKANAGNQLLAQNLG